MNERHWDIMGATNLLCNISNIEIFVWHRLKVLRHSMWRDKALQSYEIVLVFLKTIRYFHCFRNCFLVKQWFELNANERFSSSKKKSNSPRMLNQRFKILKRKSSNASLNMCYLIRFLHILKLKHWDIPSIISDHLFIYNIGDIA